MNIIDIDNFPFKIPNNHYIKIPKECSFYFASKVSDLDNNPVLIQDISDTIILRLLSGYLLLISEEELSYYNHNPKEIKWNKSY